MALVRFCWELSVLGLGLHFWDRPGVAPGCRKPETSDITGGHFSLSTIH